MVHGCGAMWIAVYRWSRRPSHTSTGRFLNRTHDNHTLHFFSVSQTKPAQPKTWTTRALLAWMADAFTKKGLDSPRLMSELLMAHVIGCDRLKLYMDADRPASPLERDQLRDLVGRALKHEPVQYLVGEGWFFGMPFFVDKRVLIPRPATEAIIEEVIHHTRAEPGFGGKTGEGVRIADVCTGSGCIALALLKNLPQATAIATDLSTDALDVARKNADRHKLSDRIEFAQGDMAQPLIAHPGGRGIELHYLCANPPYIPDAEWDAPDQVDKNVRDFEPHPALRGGSDGLKFIRPLIDAVAANPKLIRPRGLLLIETAAATTNEVAALCGAVPTLERVRIAKDHEGLDRVVVAARRE